MHSYRGQLLAGGQIRVDPASVFIQFHSHADDAASSWYGYLLLKSEKEVELGGTYVLRLEDGRSGSLRVDELDAEASGKIRAIFVGEGELR
jgi:hypothetical protein